MLWGAQNIGNMLVFDAIYTVKNNCNVPEELLEEEDLRNSEMLPVGL